MRADIYSSTSCHWEPWQHGGVPLWGTYIYSSESCQWEPWQHWGVPLCEGWHLLIIALSMGTMTTWSCQQAVNRNGDVLLCEGCTCTHQQLSQGKVKVRTNLYLSCNLESFETWEVLKLGKFWNLESFETWKVFGCWIISNAFDWNFFWIYVEQE